MYTRNSLLSICEVFLRPHLDYCDVIYDKRRYEMFIDTLGSIKYNATLVITFAIKGTSKNIYYEFGLEYLTVRRWIKWLCLFHKIFKLKSPNYLCDQYHSFLVFMQIETIQNIQSFNSRNSYEFIFPKYCKWMEQTWCKDYKYNIIIPNWFYWVLFNSTLWYIWNPQSCLIAVANNATNESVSFEST